MTLDLKGKLRFWCLLSLAINCGLCFVGLWMPRLLIASFLILMVTFLMRSDSAEDI